MNIFAKIRAGFTFALGEVLHQEGVIVALTEAEFAAAEHKLEALAENLARDLHLTKGRALAISPAVSAGVYSLADKPATETVHAGGGAPDPAVTQAAAEHAAAAAEPVLPAIGEHETSAESAA